ncbi:MAG: O-antigen ligase family protein [Roseateles sp.]|uniref:O-antigen ligase family protein n=1 Tax=Roseateles sp. TaxID=1971397 RepID=UPI0039E791A3
MAYLALVPLVPPAAASAHDASRLLQVVLLAVAALLALPGRGSGELPLPGWLRGSASGGLALSVLAVLASPHRAASAQEFALMAGLAGLALQIGRAASAGAPAWAYASLLAGSGAHLALLTGVYVAALAGNSPLDARLLHLGFDNPRFFNHVQTVAVPVLLGWSVVAPSRLQRRAALAMVSLHFAWLFMDLARASLLALAIAVPWLAWVGAASLWRRLLLCAVGGAAIHAALFMALPAVLGRVWTGQFASAQELGSAHSRDQLLAAAAELIHAHPWLGAGPMHFAALTHPKGAHPHNFYLQWAAEFGLPALLLLLPLLVLPLWRASTVLRQSPANAPPMTAALGAAVLAALVDAAFSGNFVMPVSQVWIAVVYGLLLGSLPSSQRMRRPGPHRLGVALLVALQAMLCMQAWRQWHQDPPRMSASSPTTEAEQRPRPRFWRDGWF